MFRKKGRVFSLLWLSLKPFSTFLCSRVFAWISLNGFSTRLLFLVGSYNSLIQTSITFSMISFPFYLSIFWENNFKVDLFIHVRANIPFFGTFFSLTSFFSLDIVVLSLLLGFWFSNTNLNIVLYSQNYIEAYILNYTNVPSYLAGYWFICHLFQHQRDWKPWILWTNYLLIFVWWQCFLGIGMRFWAMKKR